MTVSRHHASWRWDFWKNGQRYKKGGYATKQEAKTAESDFRKTLKQTNMAFIKLCESRLEELELKRTKQHFKENRTLMRIPMKSATHYDPKRPPVPGQSGHPL